MHLIWVDLSFLAILRWMKMKRWNSLAGFTNLMLTFFLIAIFRLTISECSEWKGVACASQKWIIMSVQHFNPIWKIYRTQHFLRSKRSCKTSLLQNESCLFLYTVMSLQVWVCTVFLIKSDVNHFSQEQGSTIGSRSPNSWALSYRSFVLILSVCRRNLPWCVGALTRWIGSYSHNHL